ncbi:hypothetical protein VZT92_003871 [Zoarces viviparus]|uniref:Uncharacterized protein n=1 Tax=Zoarces viviparus TaxID=48416 RepID=A0AAW1FY99_ZOAVI
MSVQIFVEALVSWIFGKAKVNWTTAESEAIIMRLVERTWIEVQGVDFDLTPNTFKELDKAIFQDLCKKWGGVEMVLLSMTRGTRTWKLHPLSKIA